jgi:hypothetical protein
MKKLWQKLLSYFRSCDEENVDTSQVIRTSEDGARVGMVGWY